MQSILLQIAEARYLLSEDGEQEQVVSALCPAK